MDEMIISKPMLSKPTALSFLKQLIHESDKSAKELLDSMEKELLTLKQC